jgi:hypothetical protein
MGSSLKRIVAAVVGVVLLGTGALFASPAPLSHGSTAYASARASTVLAKIQKEMPGLTSNADTLGTFVSSPSYSWRTHATYLEGVKGHINRVGELIAELQQIRPQALPWQQQAITEVTSHAVQVAASTQAAIVYLNENQGRLFLPEYRDHVRTIAGSSGNLKQTVGKFLDYERTQQKLQRLQNELELTVD